MLRITSDKNNYDNEYETIFLDSNSEDNIKLIENSENLINFLNGDNLETLLISKIDNFTFEIKNLPKLHTINFEECNNIKLILGKGLDKLNILDADFESVEIIDQDNNLDSLADFSLTINNYERFLASKYWDKVTNLFVHFNKEDTTNENMKSIFIHGLNLLTIDFKNIKNMEIILYNLPKLVEISIDDPINSKLVLNEGLTSFKQLFLTNDNTIPTVIDNHDYVKNLECYSLFLTNCKDFDINDDKYKCFNSIIINYKTVKND